MKNVGWWGGLLLVGFVCFTTGCEKLEKKPRAEPVGEPKPEIKINWKTVQSDKNKKVQSLALGTDHSCVLYTDGKAACWGGNEEGQLGATGDADRDKKKTDFIPKEVKTDVLFSQLVAGDYITCGIVKDSGRVFCWGKNVFSQLGLNGVGKKNSAEPLEIVRETKEKTPAPPPAIDADPAAPVQPEDKPVRSPLNAKKLVTNLQTVCALNDTETLCWGNVTYAHLVEDKGVTSRKVDLLSLQANPMPINEIPMEKSDGHGPAWTGTTNPTDLVLLKSDVCALVDRTLRCLQAKPEPEANYQMLDLLLGKTDFYFHKSGFEEGYYMGWMKDGVVNSELYDYFPDEVTKLTAGQSHICLTSKPGDNGSEVYCSGDNSKGQLGYENVELVENLHKLEGLIATDIASGAYHSCAATDENEIKCWGDNHQGQCGAEPVKRKKNEQKQKAVKTASRS